MDTLDGERGQRLVRSKKGMGKGMKQGCEFSSGKNFFVKNICQTYLENQNTAI